MECPFCNIKERAIYEDEKVVVILSNPRLMPGHLLVLPKKHVEKLSELNSEERKALFDTAIKYQEKLLKKFPGCDLRQHYRPFLPQGKFKVNHLHIHLQPRTLNDELYQKCQKYHPDVFKPLSEKEQEEFRNI